MSYKTRLVKMFKENTGSHMLDSGGAYGRRWEKNQKRDLLKEPFQRVAFDTHETKGIISASVGVDVNTCQWLVDKLSEPDAAINKLWLAFKRAAKKRDNTWFEEVQDFLPYLESKGYTLGGYYSQGEPFSDNTYNHDRVIDQDFELTYFTASNDDGATCSEHVILMIHGGCDIRGGYTAPQLFGLADEAGLSCLGDASISCENGHSWYTDDNCHFYSSNGDTADLRDYAVLVTDEAGLADALEATKRAVEVSEKQLALDLNVKRNGLHVGPLVVCNGVGYCPHCATKIG